MSEIRFEWDEKKNGLNKRKHGVAFEEGETVFADEYALLLYDPDHSEEEDRFVQVRTSIFWLSAIPIGRTIELSESFHPGKLPAQNRSNTGAGGEL